MKKCKFIAFGGGQCSNVLPFILNDYDLIIFADTSFEHPLTYEWVRIVQSLFPEKFVWLHPEVKGDPNMWHPPICTKAMKVEPIRRYLRSIGIESAIKYLGITYEEKKRVKENSVKWVKHEYPLVKWKMTRKDCCQYLLDNMGFVPIQSGCTICKYNKGIKFNIKSQSIMNYF